MSRIKLSDGSSWPRPALETDVAYGIGHRLRYTPVENLRRGDLMEAASIIDAYSYIVAESTKAKRDLVCREIRAALGEEA